MTHRIIIPHGLAADVLRVLGDGKPRTCAAIVDAIDELRERAGRAERGWDAAIAAANEARR